MIKIITGPMNGGKSTQFLKLYEESGDGIALYSQKQYDESNTIVGYNLVLLPDKKEIPFICLKDSVCPNEDRYFIQGRFAFLKETFEQAERYILSFPDHLPVWIDEVGGLELKGLGYSNLLHKLLESDRNIILTVRDRLLEKVLNRYKTRDYSLIHTAKY